MRNHCATKHEKTVACLSSLIRWQVCLLFDHHECSHLRLPCSTHLTLTVWHRSCGQVGDPSMTKVRDKDFVTDIGDAAAFMVLVLV
jgi:hypothetical protein